MIGELIALELLCGIGIDIHVLHLDVVKAVCKLAHSIVNIEVTVAKILNRAFLVAKNDLYVIAATVRSCRLKSVIKNTEAVLGYVEGFFTDERGVKVITGV